MSFKHKRPFKGSWDIGGYCPLPIETSERRMESILHMDFETRSDVDLKTRGLHVYAESCSTEVICIAFAFDDEAPQICFHPDLIPLRVWNHVAQGGKVMSHNFPFEQTIWNKVLVRQLASMRYVGLHPFQGICTMSMAYAMGLPGSLDRASAAVGMPQQKDMEGHKLMLKMSRPKEIIDGKIIWHEEKSQLERLGRYCLQDVEVERELGRRLLRLSASENRVWQADQQINLRGIYIDERSVRAALSIVDDEKKRLDQEMRKESEGQIATCSAVAQIKTYLSFNDGVDAESIGKQDLQDLLDGEKISEKSKKILRLRQEAGKASTAKLKSMLNRISGDGRLRGTLQFCGAGTGRWAARGIQVHNFPRGVGYSDHEVEGIFNVFNSGIENKALALDMLYGKPLSVISNSLRSFITAPSGKTLIWGDFSAIEARVLAWLAGEEKVLNVFRSHGKIYEAGASEIYGVPIDEVTKDQRQIGKVGELSLGFQGGVGAFQAMAKNYGVKVPDEVAEKIKNKWREARPKIVSFWRQIEHAAIMAVKNPGAQAFLRVNKLISFKKVGSFLFCQLPSKRVISYPYPKVEPKVTPWKEIREGLTYMGEEEKKWSRIQTYGGSLTENVTQAVARDLLADAILRLEDSKIPVVFHVHDEIVCEVPEAMCHTYVSSIRDSMREVPSWAAGLPIDCSVEFGKRYQK